MSSDHKTILEQANAAVSRGDHEGFLAFCTEDVEWTFVGEQTIKGKQAVREYMKDVYVEPPVFQVDQLIAEGAFVTAVGKISLKNEEGKMIGYDYCDVWRFQDGKMAELRAFVIPTV